MPARAPTPPPVPAIVPPPEAAKVLPAHLSAAAQRASRRAAARPVPPRRAPSLGDASGVPTGAVAPLADRLHPLTDRAANARLFEYETRIKRSFDRIVPTLKEVAALRNAGDFVAQAQALTRAALGFALPEALLETAWINGPDMRRLFAWCVFETYRRMSDEFFLQDPLGGHEGAEFTAFLHDCGVHFLDVAHCADGRLAHAISYVLRLPHAAVRRRSYAGVLFDVENTVRKWIEVELRRWREGQPNSAAAPTRYLKVAVYHFSSRAPREQGCAAHGSDDTAAARAALERLYAFRQAIENGFCCGAAIDILLIGVDTDTDAIRIHVPDAAGDCALERWLDARQAYEITRALSAEQGRARLLELVRAAHASQPSLGMTRLIARLIEHNIAQIDYVRVYHGGGYADAAHAERFVGVGIGFDDLQLRNLTYFAYLKTVEEGAAHLDVGIKIFNGLLLRHGLPVPIVVRYDYHGNVPGARQRAITHCERIAQAIAARYPKLHAEGLLHCLLAVRDADTRAPIEILRSSLDTFTCGDH